MGDYYFVIELAVQINEGLDFNKGPLHGTCIGISYLTVDVI
jgi:hypothetical protein